MFHCILNSTITSIIKLLTIAGFTCSFIQAFFNDTIHSHGEFFPGDSMFNRMGSMVCSTFLREVCARVMFLFSGPSVNNINKVCTQINVTVIIIELACNLVSSDSNSSIH